MAGSRPGRQTTGSRTPRHALSPVWRTSYQIAHSPSLCVRPRSSPPERDHSRLPRSPPRPRRGLPQEAPRTRIREAFQPEQPSELPGILKGAGVGNVPVSCPGVPAVCSSKSPGICPGAECSQSVFPGPSASPGKLQIIGPIPGLLNQTQGAGRSGGPGREETAGEGPAQAWQGILTGLEQRSPSGPHGPLPVHTAHFRPTRPTSGPHGPAVAERLANDTPRDQTTAAVRGGLLLLFSHSVVSDSSATPYTIACQTPLPMGFPRQEYWSGVSFPPSGDLPDPGIKPMSPASSRQILYH